MPGTLEGGKAAASTNKTKYGSDYYARIGAMGGKRKVPKGFALMDKSKLKEISTRGGYKSRRTKA